MDVKSLYNRRGASDHVERADGSSIRLCRTLEKGLSLIAIVEPSRACPFRQLEIARIGAVKSPYIIRELSADADVRTSPPVFRRREDLPEGWS